jgi:CRISPR/Cas system-associated exonuclease Cas4 (RecB family)
MVRRIESPSSINTYKQCPRKYYYQYIERLPSLPSIHLIRGNIVHSALEDFFEIDFNKLGEVKDYKSFLKTFIGALLLKHWQLKHHELDSLRLPEEQLLHYYKESEDMLKAWVSDFVADIDDSDFVSGFKSKIPLREQKFVSEKHNVMGFIDAIESKDDKIRLIDYKTSNKPQITDAYRLQLNIYALLYFEKHNKLPDELGIYFLKFGEQTLACSMENVREAAREVLLIHELTSSGEIEFYPKRTSALCRWNTGKCDFYDTCFGRDAD